MAPSSNTALVFVIWSGASGVWVQPVMMNQIVISIMSLEGLIMFFFLKRTRDQVREEVCPFFSNLESEETVAMICVIVSNKFN